MMRLGLSRCVGSSSLGSKLTVPSPQTVSVISVSAGSCTTWRFTASARSASGSAFTKRRGKVLRGSKARPVGRMSIAITRRPRRSVKPQILFVST